MLIEFEKQVERLDREIADFEKAGNSDSAACWLLRGAKEQTEKLKAFYETQMSDHIETCHKKREVS